MKTVAPLGTRWIRIAGASGLVAVALGAFGAHGLRGRVSPEMLEIYRTGVQYHLIHAVALLAVALHQGRISTGRTIAWAWTVGTIVFAGSLYALALTGQRWLGAITPLGGLSYLLGWAALVAGRPIVDAR